MSFITRLFKGKPGANPPGLSRILIFKTAEIELQDPGADGIIWGFSLSPGAKGLSVQAVTGGELGLSLEFTDRGGELAEEINFEIPINNFEAQLLVAGIALQDCIVVTEDLIGTQRLVGTKQNPTRAAFSYSSGGESGTRGFKVSFTAIKPALIRGFSFKIPDVSLISLNKLTGPNPPGISWIKAFFVDDILKFPQPLNNVVSQSPELAPGAEIMQLISLNQGGVYDYSFNESGSGASYNHAVKIFIPISTLSDSKAFSRLIGRDIVLIASYNNNYARIIGDKDFPLDCRAKFDTGGGSGAMGFNFVFSGKTPKLAPLFTGGEITIGERPITPDPAPNMVDFEPLDFDFNDFF